MKAHIQFLTTNLNGETVEQLGSDGVYILDGRNKLQTMIQDGYNRAYMLRKIHTFKGFKVKRVTRFDCAVTVHTEIFGGIEQ